VKLPFADDVIFYDARLMTVELPLEETILGDQKRIQEQVYAGFRITDPLQFYLSVRTMAQAQIQLIQLIGSSVRRELGQVPLGALLSHDRDRVSDDIRADVAEKTKSLGIEISEIRFHRADLLIETSQAIYDRMKSERLREAKELRAQGSEWAQEIQAKADRERTVLLSQAQRQASITRGEADAEANNLLAAAYGQDPAFYEFYRSLQSYQRTLSDANPMLVLSPDARFLRTFEAGPPAPK
jgi:modulator of FtsH protease HflC